MFEPHEFLDFYSPTRSSPEERPRKSKTSRNWALPTIPGEHGTPEWHEARELSRLHTSSQKPKSRRRTHSTAQLKNLTPEPETLDERLKILPSIEEVCGDCVISSPYKFPLSPVYCDVESDKIRETKSGSLPFLYFSFFLSVGISMGLVYATSNFSGMNFLGSGFYLF